MIELNGYSRLVVVGATILLFIGMALVFEPWQIKIGFLFISFVMAHIVRHVYRIGLSKKSSGIMKSMSGDYSQDTPTIRDLQALAEWLYEVREKKKEEGVASEENENDGNGNMYQ